MNCKVGSLVGWNSAYDGDVLPDIHGLLKDGIMQVSQHGPSGMAKRSSTFPSFDFISSCSCNLKSGFSQTI